jgi:hypothetical protein
VLRSNPVWYNETSLPRSDTHGARKYRLDFEAGALPPLYDFWSVCIYRPLPYATWSEHYSIGDWCEALVHEADGSLSLYLQQMPPVLGTSNWIPTPSGPYSAELHIYELPAGRSGAIHTFTLSSSGGDGVGVVRSTGVYPVWDSNPFPRTV